MSIDVRYCAVMSALFVVIMKLYISNRRNVTWYCFNYFALMCLYVFICTLMSLYTQHYGERCA